MNSTGRSGRASNPKGCVIAIAIFAGFCLVAVVAIGAIGSSVKTGRHSSPTIGSTLAAGRTPAEKAPRARTVAVPDFAYPGDSQCALTYSRRGSSAMTWTVSVKVSGRLVMHAFNKSGDNLYHQAVRVNRGMHRFSVAVSPPQLNDIDGVLSTATSSYRCSVAPYKHKHKHKRHTHRHKAPHPVRTKPSTTVAQPTTPAAQPTTPVTQSPTPTSCYPISDEGTCYEPGEYCRYSDEGTSGIAGNGEPITCEDNDGWRWEPS
jgi:hypothetical protein